MRHTKLNQKDGLTTARTSSEIQRKSQRHASRLDELKQWFDTVEFCRTRAAAGAPLSVSGTHPSRILSKECNNDRAQSIAELLSGNTGRRTDFCHPWTMGGLLGSARPLLVAREGKPCAQMQPHYAVRISKKLGRSVLIGSRLSCHGPRLP